ncbi:conjugative transposon protein TraM [Sphingobacterium corticis]|uniref:Conjugative transposon protein TraM n=1 Tax=Sphingobacterium corticis TaxID=1812823 RepID=A0ABW5NM83_9SPHI
MEPKMITIKQRQHRRFLLMLPLLTFPFLTILFWSLGGGSPKAGNENIYQDAGLMVDLPNPDFSDQAPLTKLDYYANARKDSLLRDEQTKNDPAYVALDSQEATGEDDYFVQGDYLSQSFPASGNITFVDYQQEQVHRKMAELERTLREQSAREQNHTQTSMEMLPPRQGIATADIDRLEQLMAGLSESSGPDQELNELSGILEKIIDIQHPDRITSEGREQSNSSIDSMVAPLERFSTSLHISQLGQLDTFSGNGVGFYGIRESRSTEIKSNIIRAVIHEDQTVVDGSVVKLRFLDDVKLHNVLIPKSNFVYGVARLAGERLQIHISEVRWMDTLIPLKVSLYDLDGMIGIHVPGSITRESGMQSADRSIQALTPRMMDPSWSIQAAGAGIDAAKSLLSRKTKLIKLHLKAGHQVLLRNDQNHHYSNNSNI